MKKTIETIKCDICGNEIRKPQKEWSFVISSDGKDVTNKIIFSVSGIFPYCTSNADFCKNCIEKFAKKWVATLK